MDAVIKEEVLELMVKGKLIADRIGCCCFWQFYDDVKANVTPLAGSSLNPFSIYRSVILVVSAK